MSFTEAYLREAHTHCANHRAEVQASLVCGCFYCLETYSPTEIEDWIDDVEGTALCARCMIDSVIGDASGFPVEDRAFREEMHEFWFERTVTLDRTGNIISHQTPKSLSARIAGCFTKKTV